MKQIECAHCGTNFQGYMPRKYCSAFCYQNSKVGKKQSAECVAKRSATMTGRSYSAERRKNIGLSRLLALPSETVVELEKLLAFGMPDGYILKTLNISLRVYRRYKKELYPSGIPWQLKWLESDIEPQVVEEAIRLTKEGMRYKRIAHCLRLDPKTIKRMLQLLSKRDSTIKVNSYDSECWSTRKESSIEVLVRHYLEENGIPHSQETQLENGSKWYFDFHVTDTKLLIEVQGDYWHCNPRVYPKPTNEYQKWAIRRDFAKKDYARAKGYEVLPIWEQELNTNKINAFKRIEKEIQKCKQTQ